MKSLRSLLNPARLGARLLIVVQMVVLVGASAASAQSLLADGQVVKVDQAAGKITIKHGPLRQFGMDEGMTMVYRAAEPASLGALKPGDKIRFAPDRINGQFTAARIEKAR